MHRGMYIAASGMLSAQMRQDVMANNLANANTMGYKRLINVQRSYATRPFARLNDEYRMTPKGAVDPRPYIGPVGGGTELAATALDLTNGEQIATSNNTDLAINGRGFFVLATPQGEVLTRDGGFTLDNDGRLVSQQGYPVLGQQGVILIDDVNFRVDEAGRIRQEGTQEGDQLLVVDAPPETLQPVGGGNYAAPQGAARPLAEDSYAIHQGRLERSNVSAIKEMVEMLNVLRAYEANQRLITYQDELDGRVANDLGTVR